MRFTVAQPGSAPALGAQWHENIVFGHSFGTAQLSLRRAGRMFLRGLYWLACPFPGDREFQGAPRMELLTGKEAATRVQGIVLPKYQVHGHSVDLTVRELYAIDPTGKVDFGGSEYEAAGRAPVGTVRRHPEDRYSWWEVARGSYFIEFNETLELAADEAALLEPHDRLLRAGASHAAVFLRGHIAPLQTLLYVNALHLEIKQNARISRLLVFRLEGVSEAAEVPPLPGGSKTGKIPRSKAKHR